MDISAIVDQVVSHVQDAPEKIKDIIADPKGAIEEITGQDLGDVDFGEIVEQVKSRIGEAGIDIEGIIGNIGENLGDVADNLGEKVSDRLGDIFKK